MVVGMNLSNEMKIKAQWVADLMKVDGVAPESVTPELAMAYFEEVGRRIAKIQTIYLTRTGAKEAMQAHILSIA